MDTDEAALYIACTLTPAEIEQEGLTHVVHQRRYKTGARPGLTCKAVVGGPKGWKTRRGSSQAESREGGRKERCLVAF